MKKSSMVSGFVCVLIVWMALSCYFFFDKKSERQYTQSREIINRNLTELDDLISLIHELRVVDLQISITRGSEYFARHDSLAEAIGNVLSYLTNLREQQTGDTRFHTLNQRTEAYVRKISVLLKARAFSKNPGLIRPFFRSLADISRLASEIRATEGAKLQHLRVLFRKNMRTEMYSLIIGTIVSLLLIIIIFFLLYRQTALREKTNRILHIRAAQQAAIASLGQFALTNPELPILMQEATIEAAKNLEMQYGKILRLDPAGQILYPIASFGWEIDNIKNQIFSTEKHTLAGYTLETGKPVAAEDIAIEKRFQGSDFFRENHIAGGITVPIAGIKEAYGILGVYSQQKKHFTKDDINFTRSISNILSAAIERENAQRELLVLKSAVESSNNAIAITDLDGILIYTNPSFREMWQYPETTTYPPQPTASFWWDENQVSVMLREIREKGIYKEEIEGKRGDGTSFTARVSAIMVKDSNGKAFCIMSSFIDISDLIDSQKAIRQSQARYRELTDSITDLFFALDQRLKFTYCNPAFESLVGLRCEEILQEKLADILSNARDTRPVRIYLQVLRNKIPQDFEYEFNFNGKHYIFEISVYPTYNGISVIARDISQRILAERALRDSETRFRSIFDYATAGMATLTPQGNFLQVNHFFCDLLGYCRDELMQLDVESITFPEDRPATRNEFQDIVTGRKTTINIEKRYIHKNGTLVWGKTTAVWIHDSSGKPEYGVALIQNVTDQKKAVTALIKSGKRYRMLFENSPISLWEEDFSGIKEYTKNLAAEGVGDIKKYLNSHPDFVWKCISTVKIRDVNQTTVTMYKAKRKKDLLGGLQQITNSDSLEVLKETITAVAEDKTAFENETVSVDLEGRRMNILLRWSVLPGFESNYRKVLVSAFDMTQLKKTRAALAEASALLERTFQSLSDAILVIDISDRRIVMCNPAVQHIFGYTALELIEQQADLLYPDPQTFHKFMARVKRKIEKDGIFQGEFQLKRRDGTMLDTEHMVVPLRKSEGWNSGIVSIIRDITERKKNTEALKMSQLRLRALAMKQQEAIEKERAFIAREIHDDLGQALTLLQLDLIQLEDHLAASDEKGQQQIRKMTLNVDSIIDKIRTLARDLRPSILDNLGLGAALEWQVSQLRERTGIQFHADVDATLVLSGEVSTSLYRIFQEAVTNVLRHADATEVTISLYSRGNTVILEVQDDGIGFLSDPRSTSSSLGILGMQERTRAIGGQFNIKSEQEKGTGIIVSIPYAEEAGND